MWFCLNEACGKRESSEKSKRSEQIAPLYLLLVAGGPGVVSSEHSLPQGMEQGGNSGSLWALRAPPCLTFGTDVQGRATALQSRDAVKLLHQGPFPPLHLHCVMTSKVIRTVVVW